MVNFRTEHPFCVSTESHICICMYVRTYICMYVHMYVLHTYLCMYVCMYVHMHVQTYVCMYVYEYMHMNVFLFQIPNTSILRPITNLQISIPYKPCANNEYLSMNAFKSLHVLYEHRWLVEVPTQIPVGL